MARCPFATWMPISGSSGSHLGGPFKIVHHTTEGSSMEGAVSTFSKNRSDPHFTVDATRIVQHIDTAEAARSLRNEAGGVQTNRDSAVQIELVGFAHLPKDPQALANVARLCRWIESVHGVPCDWPAGVPRTANSRGQDPGGHNRDQKTWDNVSGHFGHCHVPENDHWDPGYTQGEVTFLMAATFDAAGKLIAPQLPERASRGRRQAPMRKGKRRLSRSEASTMPDHGVVPVGTRAYIRDMSLGGAAHEPLSRPAMTKRRATASPMTRDAAAAAAINVGSVVSFVEGVTAVEREDVQYSVQLAQRGASGEFDRFTETRAWYQKYVEILENVGWTIDQFGFTLYDQNQGEFRMDKAALAIISAIATQNQLAVITQSIDALSKLAESDGTIKLFDFHSTLEGGGNFQVGAVQRGNGTLSMALGAFHFRAADHRRQFLFFKWGQQQVNFWTAAQRMTLNQDYYASCRKDVMERLKAEFPQYVSSLKLGKR